MFSHLKSPSDEEGKESNPLRQSPGVFVNEPTGHTYMPPRPDGHIETWEDGTQVFLSSVSGGAAKEGLWGKITIMFVPLEGPTRFKEYTCTGEHELHHGDPKETTVGTR